MLNQVIIVGNLINDPELETLEDGSVKTKITLAINRSYKNDKTGEYGTDIITCTLWQGIAQNTVDYCKKGATVGVKARLECKSEETPIEVIAEKITFVQSKNNV